MNPALQHPDKIISSILKHDNKQNSYKFALLRSINDVALAYPDVSTVGKDVAIPLTMLARYWVAYYWAFVDDSNPVYQGTRIKHGESIKNDIAFREELTELRKLWTKVSPSMSDPSDGFTLTHEMLIPRKQAEYENIDKNLVRAYKRTLKKIEKSLHQPMRYAGTKFEGEFAVFKLLNRLQDAGDDIVGIPGANLDDKCIVVPLVMWNAFRDLSLWVEALCVHEWSLFVGRVKENEEVRPGKIFDLLIARPDNRVPLDWERRRILYLMQEGIKFKCIWTARDLESDNYALDHLIPVSIYPMNEMWNLVPTHPAANLKKSNKIPSLSLLNFAQRYLVDTYRNYHLHPELSNALNEDSKVRFSTLTEHVSPEMLTNRVVNFIEQIADARHLARMESF